MLHSNERMDLIIEYLSSYEAKIHLANKHGLLNDAKMYELFAIEVCNLWFKQEFNNLNTETSNYPYVDLVSDDGQLFVQVSTAQNISPKIETTLEKIQNLKDSQCSNIKNVIFFVLYNNAKNLKEYCGDTQIGNLSFTVKENLITLDDVIAKAENDLDFQKNLYEVLKRDFDNFAAVAESLKNALDISVSGLKKIDIQINQEYEIDRSEFVDEIKSDNKQFISIQGPAGSGKTVLCKQYVKDEELVLYTRAERFLEESQLDNIWNCSIQDALEYLNGKKLVIFIDALEFIADCSQTKMELLDYLYDTVENYQNVYIVTSCRNSEKNKFIQLEAGHSIQVYEVEDINDDELKSLMARYPILRKMDDLNSYTGLLKSPFYINLIVSNFIDIDNIHDENTLREFIWENVICLKEKSESYPFGWDRIVNTVGQIVFERAKNYLSGVYMEDLDGEILKILLSEDIIIQPDKKHVRMKYDIFEDICFEHYFDKEFEQCRGNYNAFYDAIETYGRCVYRRYQIWIPNKIFIQTNREKFLWHLLFSDTVFVDWRRQTEIGIIKSKYCEDYFTEQGDAVLGHGLLPEFVKNTNLFAFDYSLTQTGETFPQMQLIPIGKGRPCIIRILNSYGIYKQGKVGKNDIVKLCLDYTKQKDKENDVVNDAGAMMKYFVESSVNDLSQDEYYRIIDEIAPCLEVLYRLGEYEKEWLRDFFSILIKNYTCDVRKSIRVSEDVIKWTFKHCHSALMRDAADLLCKMADILWLHEEEDISESSYMSFKSSSECFDYGLSEQAECYNSTFRNMYENTFLFSLFFCSQKKGLEWAIHFINKTISHYTANNPDRVRKISLKTGVDSEVKEYWGNARMWVAGTVDQQVPTLLGDIVYVLRIAIIDWLTKLESKHERFVDWANYVKGIIYAKSNNVLLLSIIENIGMHFKNELPGYALELASSIDIIYYDISRYALYHETPVQRSLKQRILLTVGLPKFEDRYELDPQCNLSIGNYMCKAQLYCGAEIQAKCYEILDYLYSTIKSDGENAQDYLQVQKMDLRNAKEMKIAENIVWLEPQITGAAEKIVIDQRQLNKPQQELENLIATCIDQMEAGEVNLPLLLDVIEKILELMENEDEAFQYEQVLIMLITAALSQSELSVEEREAFCTIWLNGLEKLINKGSFLANLQLTPVLLNQLDNNINIEIKNRIKAFMLECLMDGEEQAVIAELVDYVRKYLAAHKSLAQAAFNTIINLSVIQANNADKGKILEEYLFQEKSFEMDKLDINQYDIVRLCPIVNCGLNFTDAQFKTVINKMVLFLIDAWKEGVESYDYYKVIDIYQEFAIVRLFQREMVQTQDDANAVIDILFDEIDFGKFTEHAIEFYQNIFDNFLCEFFDAYSDTKRREICKKKILYIEKRVLEIDDIHVQKQFYRSLMLSVTMYSSGDWRELKTKYSYEDKLFLNDQFTKYGKYYIGDLLRTINQMHIEELLPEILLSIRASFQNAKNEEIETFEKSTKENESIIQKIILKAYATFSDEIKQDQELCEAFEDILAMLIDLNYAQAAVILDAFRMH